MVFQQYSLHRTGAREPCLPVAVHALQTLEDEIVRKTTEVAEVLSITHLLDNKATALSGGEMQGFDWWAGPDPVVHLMDEPRAPWMQNCAPICESS